MIFRIDMFGDDAPTESKMVDGRIKDFEKAKKAAQDAAALFHDEHNCPAGQADLIGDGDLLGSWVWGDGDCRWEDAENGGTGDGSI